MPENPQEVQTIRQQVDAVFAETWSSPDSSHNLGPKYELFEHYIADLRKTEAVLAELNSRETRDPIRDINIAAYVNRDNDEIVETLCSTIDYGMCIDSGGSADFCGAKDIDDMRLLCRETQAGRYIW